MMLVCTALAAVLAFVGAARASGSFAAAALRLNGAQPVALPSNADYNYNAAFVPNGALGALLVRVQNRTSPTDPFAVGPSAIAFSARIKGSAPFSFAPIGADSIVMAPSGADDNFGCEDPRVAFDASTQTYYLLYSAVAQNTTSGVVTSRLALATSKTPSVRWIKHGPVFPTQLPHNGWSKSGAMLIRPSAPHFLFFGDSSFVPGLRWATSTDLLNWTLGSGLFLPVRHTHFDSGLVEAGPPPMLMKQHNAYFFIYNSARHGYPSVKPGYDFQYNIGWAVLNASDPTRVIQRAETPLLSPVLDFETGSPPALDLTPNVVFCEGAQQIADNEFLMFYGAADAVIGVAKVVVSSNTTTKAFQVSIEIAAAKN